MNLELILAVYLEMHATKSLSVLYSYRMQLYVNALSTIFIIH